MNSCNHKSNNDIKSNFLYVNPSFSDLLTAINQLRNKNSVTFQFHDHFFDNQNSLISNIYTENILKIQSASKKEKTIFSLFLVAPHLVKLKQVNYPHSIFSRFAMTLSDYYAQRDDLRKAIIKFDENNKSVGFYEYEINYGRLYIELIKYIESIGGKIMIASQIIKDDRYSEIIAREKIKLPKSVNYKEINRLKEYDLDLQSSYKINSFDQLDELINEQFDIAKQINITFDNFKLLFYKYGKQIERITEKAYEIYAKNHNVLNPWKVAEKWFQEEFEWWVIQSE